MGATIPRGRLQILELARMGRRLATELEEERVAFHVEGEIARRGRTLDNAARRRS